MIPRATFRFSLVAALLGVALGAGCGSDTPADGQDGRGGEAGSGGALSNTGGAVSTGGDTSSGGQSGGASGGQTGPAV